MDADDMKGIRYALQNRFGIKVVTQTQIVIVSTLIKHPGLRAYQVAKRLEKSHGLSTSGTLKAYKRLQDFAVIEQGHLNLIASDMVPHLNGERLAYPLVGFVKERVLPEDVARYEWPHIAAWIASQDNPIELCAQLKKVINPVDQLATLYEMQNGLAFCSIMAGDVSQWAEVKGEIQLLKSVVDLLKEAGIKVK